MFRLTYARAASYALLTGTLMFAVNAACASAFDPCPETKNIEDSGQLDDTWRLSFINGSSVPTPDPTKTARTINSGSVTFHTDLFERGGDGCADIKKSFGKAIGVVTITENGTTTTKRGTGRFFKDHTSGEITITAAGLEAKAIQSGCCNLSITNEGNLALIFAAKGTIATAYFTRQ